MITGDINHLEEYKKQLPSFIYQCLNAVKTFPFDDRPNGKYDICGCSMSVESPATERVEDRKLEGHKKFIDIQFEIRGEEEWIGVETSFEAGPCTEAHEDRDLYFYESGKNGESRIYFTTGRFAVFFPEDLHRPLCMGEKGVLTLRKAVVKVPVDRV